ncbi:hypothetical protein NW762_013422 [Fusarium torreyae]|uniref:Transcription factor domain-containing protein n=1 Tax=Fusarium torreyae TaxID=1237075 RepID=A0A9W8RNI4_9HYPO|nr:hypothetical protein NW762_013422 [Fusarium torreyae]
MFSACNADRWANLETSEISYMNPPVMDLQAFLQGFPTVRPSGSVAIDTLLSAAALNMSHVRNRVLRQGDGTLRHVLFPMQHFQADTAGSANAQLLRAIYTNYGQEYLKKDPNSMTLWHSMCISLTANLDLFEIAAGREGNVAAKAALQKILQWTDSPYARRACLHAAQAFACMLKRKITDGTRFMSEIAIFHSALVLGLYIYASPPSLDQGDDRPLELLDEVDWNRVADEGLPGWTSSNLDNEYPPNKFINRGGSISFDGMVLSGGWGSARRIIMFYSGLLDQTGRWNWRKFRQILHLMSDSMVELT